MIALRAPLLRRGPLTGARKPAMSCICAHSPCSGSRYAFDATTTPKPSSPALQSSLGGLPLLLCAPSPLYLLCRVLMKPNRDLAEKELLISFPSTA